MSDSRHDWLLGAGIFVSLATVYVLSMPASVVLEDDGLFIMAACFNGITHPPGYPLYTLLAGVAASFPFASVAARVHFFSAMVAAASCVLLYFVTRRLLDSRRDALFAALCVGVSPVFWSQAIIAEVYSLNIFLCLSLLLAIVRLCYTDPPSTAVIAVLAKDDRVPPGAAYIAVMGLLFGLALANHWPLVILTTPCLLLLALPGWRGLRKHAGWGLAGVILGLTPYIWLWLRSRSAVPINFYGPLSSLPDFLFFVGRTGYRLVDANPNAGIFDNFQFLGFLIREALRQFGVAGTALALLGFARQWRCWPRCMAWAFSLGFLCNSLLLAGLLNFRYEYLYTLVIRVYPLFAYVILALWMALGLHTAAGWLGHRQLIRSLSVQLARLVPGLLAFCLLLLVFRTGLAVNDRSDYRWARDYADAVLSTVPPDTTLIVSGDVQTPPLGYARFVERQRTDIRLLNAEGLVFGDRLFHPYKSSPGDRRRALDALIETAGGPVCFTGGVRTRRQVVDYLLFRCIEEKNQVSSFAFSKAIEDYLLSELVAAPSMDGWTNHARAELLTNISRRLYPAMRSGDFQDESHWQPLFEALQDDPHGILGMMQSIVTDGLGSNSLNDGAVLLQQLDYIPVYTPDFDRSFFFTLRGFVFESSGRIDAAISDYEQALHLWPGARNPARKKLHLLRAASRDSAGR